MGDDAEALVTAEAEGLASVTRAAIGLVSAGLDRVTTDVVAAVQIERSDDAVVARLAPVLAVAGRAVLGIVRAG